MMKIRKTDFGEFCNTGIAAKCRYAFFYTKVKFENDVLKFL